MKFKPLTIDCLVAPASSHKKMKQHLIAVPDLCCCKLKPRKKKRLDCTAKKFMVVIPLRWLGMLAGLWFGRQMGRVRWCMMLVLGFLQV